MKALIYLRVSSDQQAFNENPIATQKEACLTYAERNGHEVIEIVADEGFTGRNGDREKFQYLREQIRTNPSVEGVIAYDISRIFRNGVEFFLFKEELEKYGKRFLSVSEPMGTDNTPANFMLSWMLAGFAEFRSRQDGEKIKLGMINKAKNGIYPGHAPFGYKNMREKTSSGRDRRWMEIDPETAPWVKKVFESYATGEYSLSSLAEELTSQNFPAPKSKALKPSVLEEILRKKTYTGWISWGGVEAPGTHEPIISEELFEQIQDVLKEHNLGADRSRKHKFLLGGLAYCGECGSRVQGGKNRSRNGTHYPYYCCYKRREGSKVSCHQSFVPISTLDGQLGLIVQALELREDQIPRISAPEGQAEAKEVLEQKAKDLAIKKKSLLDKYVAGFIEDADYKKCQDEFRTEEKKIHNELSYLKSEAGVMNDLMEKAIETARTCSRTFEFGSYEEKINLVNTLFERITIKDKHITSIKLKDPFSSIFPEKIGKPLEIAGVPSMLILA